MYVNIALDTARAKAGVPVSAVLPTAERNVVLWTRRRPLEPRFVELGRKYGDYYA